MSVQQGLAMIERQDGPTDNQVIFRIESDGAGLRVRTSPRDTLDRINRIRQACDIAEERFVTDRARHEGHDVRCAVAGAPGTGRHVWCEDCGVDLENTIRVLTEAEVR